MVFSRVLGRRVVLRWAQAGKVIYLDEVAYNVEEVQQLKSRAEVRPAELRQLHEVKKSFEGRIVGGCALQKQVVGSNDAGPGRGSRGE